MAIGNLSTLNISNLNFSMPATACARGGMVSLQCIQTQFCHQFTAYYLHYGLAVLIFYELIRWLDWWLITKGHLTDIKGVETLDISLWVFRLYLPGDTRREETRAFWHDVFLMVREKALWLFVLIVVWLNFPT